MVKKGLSRRLTDIEHERRRAKSEMPFISTSGVSASCLSAGNEYWAPMDPIFYYQWSSCFRPVLTRSPLYKKRVEIGWTEPRLNIFKNELPLIGTYSWFTLFGLKQHSFSLSDNNLHGFWMNGFCFLFCRLCRYDLSLTTMGPRKIFLDRNQNILNHVFLTSNR